MSDHPLFILISVVLAAVTGYYLGASVSAENVDNLTTTLYNTSAALFTVSGIWIAYMYPEAIAYFTKSDKVSLLKGTEHTSRIQELVLVILKCALVILSLLIFDTVKLLFSNLDWVVDNKLLVKSVSVSFIVFLAIIQATAILSIILNNIRFVNRVHHLRTEKELDDDL
jgi:hypothetical protein